MQKLEEGDVRIQPTSFPWRSIQRASVSRYGMVSTAHHRATAIGVRVLEEGGNAMDAAVACAFALGVCEPAASGLGGQTLMLIYHAPSRQKVALDGSSRAPCAAAPGSLKRAEVRRGYRCATVPGVGRLHDRQNSWPEKQPAATSIVPRAGSKRDRQRVPAVVTIAQLLLLRG